MSLPAAAPSTPAAKAAAARLATMTPPRAPAPEAPAAPATRKEARKAKKAKGGEDGEKAPKKKPVKLIAAVLLVLVAGYVVKGKVLKPHYAPGQVVPLGQVVSLPRVTTNLADGHLAQVDVSIQLTKPASSKAVSAKQPAMVATIVSDLGGETYPRLLPPAGRVALRAELLRGFQQILGTSEGAQQVVAVYITGFVLQ